MKVIKLTWRDSHRYLYQESVDEDFEVTTIITIGFLVSEDDDKIVLAQDQINDDVRGIIVIPKENIIKKEQYERH